MQPSRRQPKRQGRIKLTDEVSSLSINLSSIATSSSFADADVAALNEEKVIQSFLVSVYSFSLLPSFLYFLFAVPFFRNSLSLSLSRFTNFELLNFFLQKKRRRSLYLIATSCSAAMHFMWSWCMYRGRQAVQESFGITSTTAGGGEVAVGIEYVNVRRSHDDEAVMCMLCDASCADGT